MNNENNGMQKRMLIMTLIVFVFFIAYEFLVLKPKQEAREAAAKIELKKEQNAAPQVNQNGNLAPNNMSSDLGALSTKNISTSSIVSTITTLHNIIEIDSLGRIAQVTLRDKQYHDEDGNAIKLFENNQLRPLEVRFTNREINNESQEVKIKTSATTLDATKAIQSLILTQELKCTTLRKAFTFYPDGHYDLTVTSTNNAKFFITNGFRPSVLVDMYADHGLIVKQSDGTTELVSDEDLDKNKSFSAISFVSSFDRYYATVIYNFKQNMSITLLPDNEGNPQGFIHGGDNISFSGYMGPKTFKTLEALNPELTDVIEYGFFTFIAKPMFLLLQYMHSIIGNWGWTIVFVTILIKGILFPLSYKGMVSMQKLKDLSPKMKEIQAKYKDDKQKQSMHMMELYKKHGANPMGGCLPLIMQIPVFFAIYRVLLNAIELKGSEWILWIHDLAEMDPYFILPVLMGASMFLQQKITPNSMQDEMQKKIFQMLPIVFTFFFLWFPAGLTLYWVVNNVFTISQQYYINKVFEKQRAAKKH